MPTAGLVNKRIAVIGGGINGVMSAWALQKDGAEVTLFEADALMSQTSAASTKMLHGGLRYLANGQFNLVRESLGERRWWMGHATPFTRPLPIILPIQTGRWAERIKLGLGVKLYDFLARGSGFPKSRWIASSEIKELFADLKYERLAGGWLYWDAQMDDAALGRWAAQQVLANGVKIREHTRVLKLSTDGSVELASGIESYDIVVNACGPWAEAVLKDSQIHSKEGLRLVRGSHLLLNQPLEVGLALPRANNRLVFYLPFKDKALLGTTEVEQQINEPICVSPKERQELIDCYNEWFKTPITADQIIKEFSGLRPIVRQSGMSVSRASRESSVEINGRVVSILGGKWTTARLQGIAAKNACIAVLQDSVQR